MGLLLAQVVPLALGAMVSPVLLVVQILTITGRTKPIARAAAISLGSAITLIAITAVLLTIGRSVNISVPSGSDPVGAAIRGLCAALLLFLGIRNLAKRHQPRPPRKNRLATAKTRGYFVAGLVAMLTNVTSLALYVPALHTIDHSTVNTAGKALAVGILFLCTMLPLLAPLGIAVAMGPKSHDVLAALNRFVTANQAVITAAFCFVFAAYLAYAAIRSV